MMSKPKYEFDYENLFGRMKANRFSQRKLAEAIGISEGSMSIKLKGKPFTQDEIKSMCKVLQIPDSEMATYFFKVKVQKTEQKQYV